LQCGTSATHTSLYPVYHLRRRLCGAIQVLKQNTKNKYKESRDKRNYAGISPTFRSKSTQKHLSVFVKNEYGLSLDHLLLVKSDHVG